MTGFRFADVQARPAEFINLTSLTLEDFEVLVSPFESAFQDHMAAWRLDGKPRTARSRTSWFTRGLRRIVKIVRSCLPLPPLWAARLN